MALLQICSKSLSVRLPVCPVNKNKVLSLCLFPDRFKAVPLFFYIHVACFVRFVFLLCSSECFFIYHGRVAACLVGLLFSFVNEHLDEPVEPSRLVSLG